MHDYAGFSPGYASKDHTYQLGCDLYSDPPGHVESQPSRLLLNIAMFPCYNCDSLTRTWVHFGCNENQVTGPYYPRLVP